MCFRYLNPEIRTGERLPGLALREIASQSRFRRAMLWQNRHALQTGVASLLRQREGAADSKTRQHEALVAYYAQRYSMKNESIGFFGPVAWARFDCSVSAIQMAHGHRLISKREVYFEH